MDWGSCLDKATQIPTLACVPVLFHIAISTALSLVGTISLLLIIAAGIKYITSGGGKAVEEAQKMLTYAILGLVIVLAAFFIVNIIAYLTGVHCLAQFNFNGCDVYPH